MKINVYVVRQIQYTEVPVTARLMKMNVARLVKMNVARLVKINVYVVRQIQYTAVPARARLLPMRRSLFYDCCTSFVTFHTFSSLGVVFFFFFCHFGLIARTFKCLNGSVLLHPVSGSIVIL